MLIVATRMPLERQDELWALRHGGMPNTRIAVVLSCARGTVQTIVRDAGGVRPRPRKAPAVALTLEQREEISRGLVAGLSFGQIARELERAVSTVSREVGGVAGRASYRAAAAHQRAQANRARPKPRKMVQRPELAELVEGKLRLKWAPQQIAAWLRETYPGQPEMQVSHETIYVTLYVQARGELKRELTAFLRRRRDVRRARAARPSKTGTTSIRDAVSISERPAEVADRAVPGHWEGDLIVGSHDSYIATLVERKSRFVMLARVDNKCTETVMAALREQVQKLPADLFRTLTLDRGTEFSGHAQFSVDTGVQVYFCDPQSPWQRGSNENTNGLLRDYWPKGMDLRVLSDTDIQTVADQLNTRPRQTLGWKTPAHFLNEALATTA